MGDAAVEQCVAGLVGTWVFPKPVGGGVVIVSYPFVLKPSESASPPTAPAAAHSGSI